MFLPSDISFLESWKICPEISCKFFLFRLKNICILNLFVQYCLQWIDDIILLSTTRCHEQRSKESLVPLLILKFLLFLLLTYNSVIWFTLNFTLLAQLLLRFIFLMFILCGGLTVFKLSDSSFPVYFIWCIKIKYFLLLDQ